MLSVETPSVGIVSDAGFSGLRENEMVLMFILVRQVRLKKRLETGRASLMNWAPRGGTIWRRKWRRGSNRRDTERIGYHSIETVTP